MRRTVCTVLISVLMVLLNPTASAHDTMSEFYPDPDKNEGVVQFFYSNDDLMSNSEITVYDVSGVQIAEGVTDANGLFDFSVFDNVGHIIAQPDDEHIQIHIVSEGGAYIIGKDFGGTYVGYSQLNGLLRNFVLDRYWLNIYVLVIPAIVLAVSLVYFIVNQRELKINIIKGDNKHA